LFDKVKGERVKKEKYQNRYERRARGLIKDFEIAVRDDPHAWSAGPATAEDFAFGSGLGLFELHCFILLIFFYPFSGWSVW
jgi:DNA-binding ferritin-like protein (Dps family)